MAYWIYSTEALPNPKLMGLPGYTPDQEFIKWNGATLPPIPAKEWMKLPDSFAMLRRSDWRDRQGTAYEIPISRFKGVVNARFAERGVIMLDHPPSNAEKAELEGLSEELSLKHRKKAIEFFERERDAAIHRGGRYEPTPYVDECYEVLDQPKPYSVEAMRAQRRPGEEAADKIANAIVRALNKKETDTVEALASKEKVNEKVRS